MSERRIRVTREAFRERAALDTAVSRALLRRVARGEEPETLRVYTPADVVAFGPQDTRAAGYAEATAAARSKGFEAIERLAGGRAAVFHGGTIAFSWTMPDAVPREDVMARFDEAADIMMRALRRLGIDARVGEVPGEYCPGQHSVNARGERKLMGVGQRLIRGAAHVGGVVVVSGGERIRDVLLPVYDALEVDVAAGDGGERGGGAWGRGVRGGGGGDTWRSSGRGMGCTRGRFQGRRCGWRRGWRGSMLRRGVQVSALSRQRSGFRGANRMNRMGRLLPP